MISLLKNVFILPIVVILFLVHAQAKPVNVMGPLYMTSLEEFTAFDQQLALMKKLGVNAISIDIWWGLVEKEEGRFDFSYYDRVFTMIAKHGLKIVPILSIHRLGGNVGDTKTIEIPAWLWNKGPKDSRGDSVFQYKSEQLYSQEELKEQKRQSDLVHHRTTKEVISPWALKELSPYIESFYSEFLSRYHKALYRQIDEVNFSLGPAGEMRHPSYNSHDINAGYPTRGSLQIYSDRAIEGLRQFARERFTSIEKFNEAMGFQLKSFEQVYPPNPDQLASEHFFGSNEHRSSYGKFVFDYNQKVLLEAGHILLELATKTLQREAPLWVEQGVPVGFKIPGIHWRVGLNRGPELAAGLISTSSPIYQDVNGEAYIPLLKFIKELESRLGRNPFLLHFTAIEFFDREEVEHSRAQSLTDGVLEQAQKVGLRLAGENALGFKVHNEAAMMNVARALNRGYEKATILRMEEFSEESNSSEYLRNIISCKYTLKD